MTHSNLKEARNHVARLRAALLEGSPEAIERCLPGLAEAGECLGRVQQALERGEGRDAAFEIHALKRELTIASRLIANGARLKAGWAKLLGAAVSGYTPAGEAAPVSAAGTISIRG